ncbi:Ankyrin-3 [Colletotrichum spinosum]|uniref:Ankyrin-3 n=1 Tax=Colletotrichum spinosum TaxID=1347390 RepID=A0A4R8QEU6_9PEZI|nr:Ankyrin-3 [Colletotrichum spinosum]
MSRVPNLNGALGDFQITLAPELILMIIEELGSLVEGEHYDGHDNDFVADPAGYLHLNTDPLVSQVMEYIRQVPTLRMLTAGALNQRFRYTILRTALRWDVAREQPKALLHAARHGHDEVARLVLMESRVSVNQQDTENSYPRGMTPLMLAAWHGHANIVQMLLNHAKTDTEFRMPYAVYGQTGLGRSSRPNAFSESHLTMLGRPARVNFAFDLTPLHCALLGSRDDGSIADAVLARIPSSFNQAIANEDGRILAIAAARDVVSMIDPLINRGANVKHGGPWVYSNRNGNPHVSIPVIHHAVSAAMISKLISRGATVNTPPWIGLNPLHAVCLRGFDCRGAIQELVQSGVDVNETTAGGRQRGQQGTEHLLAWTPQTALNLACRRLNYHHIDYLVSIGAAVMGTNPPHANLNTVNFEGDGAFYRVTPLHDLFLFEYEDDDWRKLTAYDKNHTLRETLLAAVTRLVQCPGGERAIRRRVNVPIGNVPHNINRIDSRFWILPRGVDHEKLTPFDVFLMQPLVDDERILQAMFDACPDVLNDINRMMRNLGVTPLIALLSHGFDHTKGEAGFYRPRLLKWLLEHGADPNMSDSEGLSPLHYAVFWLDFEAVTMLLEYGAALETKVVLDTTALDVFMGSLITHAQQQTRAAQGIHVRTHWLNMVDAPGPLSNMQGLWEMQLLHDDRKNGIMPAWVKGEADLYLYSTERMMEAVGHEAFDDLDRRWERSKYGGTALEERQRRVWALLLEATQMQGITWRGWRHMVPTTLDYACANDVADEFIDDLVSEGAPLGLAPPSSQFQILSDDADYNWNSWRDRLQMILPGR